MDIEIMSADESSHKVQIAVAVIGLLGVLVSGVFANWDKIFPPNSKIEAVRKTTLSVADIDKITSLPPGFDCRKAETNVEKIICNNSGVSHADGQLGLLYKWLRSNMTTVDFNVLKNEQRQWVKDRDKRIYKFCQALDGLDLDCVINIYSQRISELKEIVARY